MACPSNGPKKPRWPGTPPCLATQRRGTLAWRSLIPRFPDVLGSSFSHTIWDINRLYGSSLWELLVDTALRLGCSP
eukprot:4040089-Pyramimonas_sp.AAC.1